MADREGKGLGGRIRRFREAAGLSQTELGDRLGVSYQQVQKYERGANRVSVDALIRIARALGQPFSAFVEAEAGKTPSVAEPRPEYGLSRDERDLIKAWRELPDDKLRSACLHLLRAAGRAR